MRFLRLFFCAFFILFSHVATAAKVSELQKLLATHQYQQAYDLAQKLSKKEEGDPRFDFLFGQAANQAKHPDVAVFPLERVTLLRPEYEPALLELGDAYFKLNDFNTAKMTFQKVKKNKEMAQPYFQKIAAIEKSADVRKFLNFSLRGGHDSNVTSTKNDGFRTFPPAGSSYFNTFSVNGGVIKKLDKQNALFISVGAMKKVNYSAHRFDLQNFLVAGGWAGKWGDVRMRVPVYFSNMRIGNQAFTNHVGIRPEIERTVTPEHILGASLALERYFYQLPKFPNVNRVTMNGLWKYKPTQLPLEVVTNIFQSNGFAGATRSFLVWDYYGADVTGRWRGFARQTPSLTFAYYKGKYNGIDPQFKQLRKDTLYSVKAGWEYRLGRGVSIEPSYTYMRNNSSLQLFNYNRQIFQIELKGQFNG